MSPRAREEGKQTLIEVADDAALAAVATGEDGSGKAEKVEEGKGERVGVTEDCEQPRGRNGKRERRRR